MIVVDASVILKWVLPDELDRKAALALRQRHLSGTESITAPELLWYEIANVLPRRWPDTNRAADFFREIHASEVQIYPFEAPQFTRAIEISRRHGISGYDACYVVLAEVLRCRFITADERLLSQLKGVPHVLHLKQVRS
ncbi:MAG: type II toxin-antitoxin system VapC family toxin [Candidatus Omnitrophica bacterium]|nr:type II toxin-antitoxin system VapC family toxin [Candidatus Omnitrophota bacterium]